jgi:hypothetical protein
MSGEGNQPTLTDEKGMGGIIAQNGFDYQLWDGLVRLPAWLANPAFEGLIFEGLEDLEARFFAPQVPRGRLLERYQAKSGSLAPKEVSQIFASFLTFETTYPQLARLHTLVTPRLPPTLAFVGRDPRRVRRARPFYAPFSEVATASDEKLRSDLVAAFGPQMGEFVAQGVEVHERMLPDRDSAMQAFGLALHRAFPDLGTSIDKIEAAFEALSAHARRSIGVPLSRAVLADVLSSNLGRPVAQWQAFPLHLRLDQNEGKPHSLEIDVSAYSGGSLPFPDPQLWASGLIDPLAVTAKWLRSNSQSRIALSGSYRLSTAFALGWSFRSATGFEIEIPTRGGVWPTDERPARGEIYPALQIGRPTRLAGDRLIVSIGIIRDPAADLVQSAGMSTTSLLRLHLPEAITSAKAAQAAVADVKEILVEMVAELKPRRVDLYLAGPAAFAVALGHRWNALPPTQLHEFLAADRRYVTTALLS